MRTHRIRIRIARCTHSQVESARRHGFSERELEVVRANYDSELKTLWLERRQQDSDAIAAECCDHFLSQEF